MKLFIQLEVELECAILNWFDEVNRQKHSPKENHLKISIIFERSTFLAVRTKVDRIFFDFLKAMYILFSS